MNRLQMPIFLFLALCLPYGANAQTNSRADDLIAAYKSLTPQMCKMLEAEQNMIAELNHVSTMMKIEDFMKLKMDDKSIPAPVRESADKIQKITAQIEEIVKTTPLEKIIKLRSELSAADEKEVAAYLNGVINKECPSIIKHSWGQGPVGQWLGRGGNSSKSISRTVKTAPSKIDFKQLQEKAESGDSTSKFILGSRLVRGYEIKQDCKMGIDWLKQASAEGIAGASLALSKIYQGIPICQDRDDRLALKYHALYLKQSKKTGK